MSLEVKIQLLTDAVTQLILVIESQKLPVVQLPVVEQVIAPTPVIAAPIVAPVPVFTPPPVAAAPVMPPPPVFAAPVVNVTPPVVAGAPFSDPKGLIEYVMTAYKTMGAAKGAGIQGVLGTLGYQNINDVAPAHYAALFAGIEGLK